MDLVTLNHLAYIATNYFKLKDKLDSKKKVYGVNKHNFY